MELQEEERSLDLNLSFLFLSSSVVRVCVLPGSRQFPLLCPFSFPRTDTAASRSAFVLAGVSCLSLEPPLLPVLCPLLSSLLRAGSRCPASREGVCPKPGPFPVPPSGDLARQLLRGFFLNS